MITDLRQDFHTGDCACVRGVESNARAELSQNRCSSMFAEEIARWFAPQAHQWAVKGLHSIDFA